MTIPFQILLVKWKIAACYAADSKNDVENVLCTLPEISNYSPIYQRNFFQHLVNHHQSVFRILRGKERIFNYLCTLDSVCNAIA